MKIEDYLYGHLVKRFASKDFHEFLKVQKIPNIKGKLKPVLEFYVVEYLAKITDPKERKEEILRFNDFICEELAYAHSRLNMCIPVKFNSKSDLICNVKSDMFDDISNLMVDDSNIDIDSTFKCCYQRKIALSDGMCLKQVYSKLVDFTVNDTSHSRIEFIYVEINTATNEVEFHFMNKPELGVDRRDKPSFSNIYSNLFEIIRNKYKLSAEQNPKGNALYLMYKSLTNQAEQKVSEKGNILDNDIKVFVKEELKKIGIGEDEVEKNKEKIFTRIKNQFLKVLVQNYFHSGEYRSQDNIGEVKNIQLRMGNGTTLQERSAQATNKFDGPGLDEDIYNLEYQDIYFSTKADVDEAEELFSLLIEWNVTSEIERDSIEKVVTEYTAYPNYYIVHVKRILLDKEIQNYVLSKIRKY